MSALKIVVADDSRTIRTQLRKYLSPSGFEVIEASTGVEALQQIQAQQPFLAILDINMPELDGYGVCLRLRDMGPPWDQLPIIFLTSLESHALELLGSELGMYLKKPVAPRALLEAVASLIPAGSHP